MLGISETMIICNIQGGLGNQMFQYAMGRSISLDLNQEVKFSIDSFAQYQTHNGFELNRVFGIEPSLASPGELKKVLGTFRSGPLMRRALAKNALRVFRGSQYRVDLQCGCDPSPIVSLGSDAYLHGYWQSEKYFSKYASQIRQDFSFKNVLDEKNAILISRIRDCNAVSIHVRRGDYVSNPKASSTHGVCSLDYYEKSIKFIAGKVQGSQFFVFTDDTQWVKEILVPLHPNIMVIDHNSGLESYRDMQLMSACSHHIIANSSFSWWGAWLNPSPDKIVVAPKAWFANGREAYDLLPPSWIRM